MPSSTTAPQQRSFFSIPPLVKALFDAFPLITYPAYPAPARSPKPSTLPRLYAWISAEEARRPGGGGYSFDAECLKWQTYLRFCGVQFKTVSSNNHACPSHSNSLPFLIPAATSSQSPTPIPAAKLAQWAREHGRHSRGTGAEEDEVDFERGDVQAFLELLDNEVRDALLYTTHIHPPNLHNLTTPLYAPSSSSTSLIRPFLSSQLRASALASLKRRHPGTLDRDTIFANADAALEALGKLLGADTWFFNGKVPGLLDAAVFAYLHVILTGEWEEDWAGGLRRGVEMRKNLVVFWERVDQWWQFAVDK